MAADSAENRLSKDLNGELARFCKNLPKAELHAHLHGSIRLATLRDFVQTSIPVKDSADAVAVIRDVLPSATRSLRDCFRIFDLIHKVVTDPSAVERITREYLDDCAEENIFYVELRTTPRAITSPGTPEHLRWLSAFADVGDISHLDQLSLVYCAVVMKTLAQSQLHGCTVLPRMLLSMNRSLPAYVQNQVHTVALNERSMVMGAESKLPKLLPLQHSCATRSWFLVWTRQRGASKLLAV
jgi:hypothetical protein